MSFMFSECWWLGLYLIFEIWFEVLFIFGVLIVRFCVIGSGYKGKGIESVCED